MIVRFIIGVVLMSSMVGCATTQKPTTTGQLQIRVTQIESQLDNQSQDITELQSIVKKLSLSSQATSARITSTSKAKKAVLSSSTRISRTAQNQNILRVPVTPQEVQTGLKNAGYYTGAIDGKLGSGSRKAIKEFQTDHDLESDGIIGKKTWADLKNYLD